jgi:hypothetical protein
MFVLIRFLSAIIGALVIIQAAILVLIGALIATPVTLTLGIIGGVVTGLGQGFGGQRIESAALREASNFSWAAGRWALDVISVLTGRYERFLGLKDQDDSPFVDAVVRDWPGWSWWLIIGETYEIAIQQGYYSHSSAPTIRTRARQVGGFPSKEVAEKALREDRIEHAERGNLGTYKDSAKDDVQEAINKIEVVKQTSANVMLTIVVIVDILAIISLIVLLTI